MKRSRIKSQPYVDDDLYDELGSSRLIQSPTSGGGVRTYRLKAPVSLPRWSRHNAYRLPNESPVVPQLAPEIHVVAPDQYLYCEAVDEGDAQVDVCAVEENEHIQYEPVPEDVPAKRTRLPTKREVVEPEDSQHASPGPSRRTKGILRRRGRKEEFCEDEQPNEDFEALEQDADYYPTPPQARRVVAAADRYSINVSELFDEISKHEPHNSIENLNDLFVNDPSIQYPLNVNALVQQVQNATPEFNARIIAGLAMQINSLKKEVQKLHADIVDTRSASMLRQNHGLTGRIFDLNASVSNDWFLVAQPPLRSVDLVGSARSLGQKLGRRNYKNKDLIIKFVRTVFEQMIPKELISQFTVRDRPSARGSANDVGIDVKEQITGCVLDLLGLLDTNHLSPSSRIDRAHFADFVNQAMKTVMYDMRRVSPKSRKFADRRSTVADKDTDEDDDCTADTSIKVD